MDNNKVVYLHIGQDKTGSSAIQSFLLKNYSLLNDSGYDLVGGRVNHHGKLQAALLAGDTERLDAAVEYVRSSGHTRFVVSFEGLYALTQERIAELIGCFGKWRIVVVLYVRRRSDKFRSGFAQNLKLMNRVHLNESRTVVEGRIGDLKPHKKPNMDYLAIVRRWQEQLLLAGGENEFRLRVFEKSSLAEGDLMTDFARSIDLLAPEESLAGARFKRPSGQTNPSLSPAAQYLCLFARILDLPEDQARRLEQLMAACDQPGASAESLIPDRMARTLDRKFESGDRQLAREFLGRRKLFGEAPKMKHKAPDGEAFTSLIREMARQGGALDDLEPGAAD